VSWAICLAFTIHIHWVSKSLTAKPIGSMGAPMCVMACLVSWVAVAGHVPRMNNTFPDVGLALALVSLTVYLAAALHAHFSRAQWLAHTT
jgi:hypothetical protein